MQFDRKRLGGAAFAALCCIGLTAVRADAQGVKAWTGKGFVNVNFGAQTKARTQTAGDSFALYDETATWETAIAVGNNSIVDISGGARVWHNLAIGIGVSTYSETAGAVVNGSVPDPLFFDRPRASSITLSALEHKERAVHLSAVYVLPIMDRLDIAVSAGPSFFSLKKEVVTGVTVPNGGTSLSAAARTSIDRSATGGHIAIDVNVMLLRGMGGRASVGGGLFVRYGTASVDAPEVNEGTIELGGLNYGGGLRFRF